MGEVQSMRDRVLDVGHLETRTLIQLRHYLRHDPRMRHEVFVELHWRLYEGEDIHPYDGRRPPDPRPSAS